MDGDRLPERGRVQRIKDSLAKDFKGGGSAGRSEAMEISGPVGRPEERQGPAPERRVFAPYEASKLRENDAFLRYAVHQHESAKADPQIRERMERRGTQRIPFPDHERENQPMAQDVHKVRFENAKGADEHPWQARKAEILESSTQQGPHAAVHGKEGIRLGSHRPK